MHLLHLEGKIAFSLATGTMTNRSKVADKSDYQVKNGANDSCVNSGDYFSKGCYNPKRSTNFKASDALRADLEALFLAGYQRDNGDKSNANKYTPIQALAFLSNLKMSNGRRKYSTDVNNNNGPLPSKSFIKSWFSRRVLSYRNELLLQQSDYNTLSEKDLRARIRNEFSEEITRFSQKGFLKLLLKYHHKVHNGIIHPSLDTTDVAIMKAECIKLQIPFEGKEALIHLLDLKYNLSKMPKQTENTRAVINSTLEAAT